ncbi:ANL_collapsed_G0053070.mRNA.1.CDS.1 [Saccharomyces cerevisiae]|nr:ANL_collapsed_G0053070.mRNA.1.CDS.1 [Saccharomyces cerevisiae]
MLLTFQYIWDQCLLALLLKPTYGKGKPRPGDVLVSNHPDIGGTHLPDITVISSSILGAIWGDYFFLASRAHHADIVVFFLVQCLPTQKNCMKKAPQFFRVDCQKGYFSRRTNLQTLPQEPAKYRLLRI